MRKPKLLVAFNDPGGALAVIPVLRKIVNDDLAEVTTVCGKFGRNLVNETGFRAIEFDEDLTKPEAEKIMTEYEPDMLLTATGGGHAEQELRNIARRKGLKSFVVLDFWKHYTRRWIYADHELSEMKDTVFVMDENVKNEMTKEGFPEDRIIVTGHPYLEILFGNNSANAQLQEFMNSYLFLSQPSDTIGLKSDGTHPLEIIMQALNELSSASGERLQLRIKLHPLEADEKMILELIDNATNHNLEIGLQLKETPVRELIECSGTVIGYNSIALFESASMGRRTFSINAFEINEPMKFAMSEAGIVFVNPDVSDLLSAFRRENSEKNMVSGLYKGAIQNCINAIFA